MAFDDLPQSDSPIREELPAPETRDVLDKDGNVIGSMTRFGGTSEEDWIASLTSYTFDPSQDWGYVRTERARIFAETKWVKDRHEDQLQRGTEPTLTPEKYQAWLEYWQGLRDIPQAFPTPGEVIWAARPPTV